MCIDIYNILKRPTVCWKTSNFTLKNLSRHHYIINRCLNRVEIGVRCLCLSSIQTKLRYLKPPVNESLHTSLSIFIFHSIHGDHVQLNAWCQNCYWLVPSHQRLINEVTLVSPWPCHPQCGQMTDRSVVAAAGEHSSTLHHSEPLVRSVGFSLWRMAGQQSSLFTICKNKKASLLMVEILFHSRHRDQAELTGLILCSVWDRSRQQPQVSRVQIIRVLKLWHQHPN